MIFHYDSCGRAESYAAQTPHCHPSLQELVTFLDAGTLEQPILIFYGSAASLTAGICFGLFDPTMISEIELCMSLYPVEKLPRGC